MFEFVDISEVRAHLRVDSLDDDPWLLAMVPAVEAAVVAWLKGRDRAYYMIDGSGHVIVDSQGDPILNVVPNPMVKAAVLVELAAQYRFRDAEGAPQVASHWGYGYTLGPGATALLTPLRKPTIG
jgi:hypothetical protein